MAPNLRSVVAQAHRKWLSIGSRRNFTSDGSSRHVSKAAAEGAVDAESKGGGVTPLYLLIQGVKGYLGCTFGLVVFGDVVTNLKEREEESRMEFESVEAMFNRVW